MQVSAQLYKVFTYYNVYRTLIALLLFGITLTQKSLSNDYRSAELYQFTTLAYLLLNISVLAYYRMDAKIGTRQLFFSVALDLLMLHSLFYLGNGVDGGLSNLVIITIAAGNIMISGRIGLALAALASLLSLSIEIERQFVTLSEFSDIARAGLIGSIYFATAYIVQNLSARISKGERLAQEQKRNILELQKLNHQIIQSMRTGIIVCDEGFRIRTLNQACTDLIGILASDSLPTQIQERIQLWRNNPGARTTPFRMDASLPLVQANFSLLQQHDETQVLVFIEDTRLMTQQAQQLKLASLGRLTASIAHEVRNPLGAISHATQLLVESPNLDQADRKMTDIIERHSKRVNRIIENTLSLSRRKEPEVEEMQVKEWLTSIINEYRTHQAQQQFFLHCHTDSAMARFDPNQIEQVLTNLLDNAMRHGNQFQKNAPVIVSLGQNSANEQAYIDIFNAGTRISGDVRKHLFEPFFTTESQGTGLGLYLSKEICEANQAQLDYIEDAPSPKELPQAVCFRILFAHPKRII